MKSEFNGGVAAVLMLLSCAAIGCNSNSTAQGDAEDNNKFPHQNVIVVKTVKAERVEMSRTIRQPATVHADQQANLYAKTSGYLESVEAEIGESVEKGSKLAVISVPEMDKQKDRQNANIKRLEAEEKRAGAEIKVAEAAAEKSRAYAKKAVANLIAVASEHTRVAGLVTKKAVAAKLLDEAKEKHEAAKAEKEATEKDVAIAEANVTLVTENENAAKEMTNVARAELAELDELIKYATLTAPFDGVVLARNVDQGDLVRNSQSSGTNGPPLFIVAKIDPVRIRVSIPERDATRIDVGQEVHVTLQAVSGQPIKATITRMAGGLDENTRTRLVEIVVPNPNGGNQLLPGMFGEATIIAEANQSRLILPAKVVRYDEYGKSYLFVVNDEDEVEVVDVTTGLDNGNQIEITKGLSGDERIVAPMIRRLKAGRKVRVE